jgi:hypothetical protein
MKNNLCRPQNTRREFLLGLAAGLGGSWLAHDLAGAESAAGANRPFPLGPAGPSGSDVGSLFPFIQSQAVKADFPLSFLQKHVPYGTYFCLPSQRLFSGLEILAARTALPRT